MTDLIDPPESLPPPRILGVTAERFAVTSLEDNRTVAVDLVRQCRRLLDISSRQLDPSIYDTDAFLTAVRALALRGGHSQIRLLVLSAEGLMTRGHRLITLAQTLSSFIQIRVPSYEYREFNEAMLLADGDGYVHRPLSDRYEGTADYHASITVVDLQRRFDRVWETGETDPGFRRLSL